ncbi:MAG: cyclic nucleotide-binding domain-containing protein [Gemmatimonadota bacterium]|nr:cyclic nucleotide-binding domain-containing protein [Gemmatimonadota bacterium]
MSLSGRVSQALNLRAGEGRTLAVMGGFLLLNTANTTVLSAAKNGLFLSVYPGDRIPHAVIGASLLTALVAIVFTGYVAGSARRSLAVGLTVVLVLSVLACRILFAIEASSAFAIYLWLSAVQVLMLTHAWDYAGDLLTGRQAKRLLPLIGVGASFGAIVGGTSVAPAAFWLGTDDLLWISMALLAIALPLLWALPEPVRDPEEHAVHMSATKAFIQRASRGVRSVGTNKLLRLLALGLIALTLTGTLIDLQLKFLLQETYPRDRITAIYGLLSATVGVGTLVLQLWASRVLFPRFGVSVAAMLHGSVLVFAAAGTAVIGGLYMLVAAQALDDILQFSLQKPVEQVSLLPFPNRVKSVALATLGGVLRPLSKASAGGVALTLSARPELLPFATVATALTAAFTYSRHRRRYMTALDSALARHAVDFSSLEHVPLVADAGALSIIDKALADSDATVVVFATALLEQLPDEDAVPRVKALLSHPISEVRAEAARVLRAIDAAPDFSTGVALAAQLAVEESPFVLAELLETIGSMGGVEKAVIERFLAHDDQLVRRAAIVALGRLDWEGTEDRLRVMLASDDSLDRAIAAGAVGDLGAVELIDPLASVLSDVHARSAALESLSALGPAAVPVMSNLLDRRELPLPLRRSVVTALERVTGSEARNALVKLLEEPALGPAALTSLNRMRVARSIDAVEARKLRPVLRAEIQRGLKYAAASTSIRRAADSPQGSFVANELQGLYQRSVGRVLKLLVLSHDIGRMSAISIALESDHVGHRSNALELLEGTISRPTAMAVMPFLEAVADDLPATRINELLDDSSDVMRSPSEALAEESDWWPRALGLHMLGRDDEITTPGQSQTDESSEAKEDGPMIPLIEKVMILKGSEFFRNFPGSDLAGIASLADVVYTEAGEVVFQQGDEGDAFFVVVRGSIKITRGQIDLATLGAREGFGEMAILDRETRSATATAHEETTLLRLDRDSFDRAIEANPVVARGIYRVLTERLRNTLAQVAAG